MTISSPDSLPDDEPGTAEKNTAGKPDGGIPDGGDGVGLGATHEPNTFEPEEDPEAAGED